MTKNVMNAGFNLLMIAVCVWAGITLRGQVLVRADFYLGMGVGIFFCLMLGHVVALIRLWVAREKS